MHWDGRRPTTLWLGPLVLGLFAGTLPYLIEHSYFDESSLKGSVGICLMISVLLPYLPEAKTNRKIEMLAGIWIGMAISYLPTAVFFVWLIPVILYWIGRTITIQDSNFPPFRIGLWIGSGILSGIYIGNIIAYNIL